MIKDIFLVQWRWFRYLVPESGWFPKAKLGLVHSLPEGLRCRVASLQRQKACSPAESLSCERRQY